MKANSTSAPAGLQEQTASLWHRGRRGHPGLDRVAGAAELVPAGCLRFCTVQGPGNPCPDAPPTPPTEILPLLRSNHQWDPVLPKEQIANSQTAESGIFLLAIGSGHPWPSQLHKILTSCQMMTFETGLYQTGPTNLVSEQRGAAFCPEAASA